MPTCVALVPARSGSKRVPGKNIRPLAGRPLMAYTIAAALASGVFESVVVSTDSPEYREIAHRYGARSLLRPAEYATDTSPDVDWVRHSLETMRGMLWRRADCFALLRPTSPFRTADTIRRAWARWCEKGAGYDSSRAVQPCREHPWKMWQYDSQSSRLEPIFGFADDWWRDGAPGHSRQYSSLPPIWVQNASLEIAWCRTVLEGGSIAGNLVLPFFTEGWEGHDINKEDDFRLAELLVAEGRVRLPAIGEELHGN